MTALPAPAAHAAPVNAGQELSGVENLRELRHALDVIHLFLDPDLDDDGAISTALRDLHRRLCDEEDQALTASGTADRYLIIRPINPFNPLAPDDMELITNAVRTLASLGMIAGRGDTR